MQTISRQEFNKMSAGIVVPTKKAVKVVDAEATKKKAIQAWRDFTMKVKVENEDGSTSIGSIKPYKELSFKEIGTVKVLWTNKASNEQKEKEYSAIEWANGKKAVFMGYFYKSVMPIPQTEGLYTFG